MIGLVSVECQAQSPNLPLYPWTAFVNSPSSIRVRNVPKKIGSWCITRVYVSVVYPDGEIKTAECVPVGGVYVGTVDGAGVSGTTENGYTIFADGTDENGNAVTGYILGRGNVTILDDDGILQPDAKRYYVRMLSAESETHFEGDLYPTESGYVIWQDGQANLLGTPFEQITSYVESAVSAKADLSALEDYAKTDELSSKADLSTLEDYVPYTVDRNGSKTAVTVGTRTSEELVGQYSMSIGVLNTLTRSNTFAVGFQNILSNDNSFAVGQRNIVGGTVSFAVGYNNKVQMSKSVAIGDTNTLSEESTQAIGTQNQVGGKYGIALGVKCRANDSGSFVWSGSDKNFAAQFPAYYSHGKGTFNVNPFGGLSGFYVGEQSLNDILSAIHGDYIEDAIGNRINANLSCTYIDDTAWEITDPSSNKYVLEYVGFIQSYHTWECIVPENIKLVLTYANDWELQVYTWQEVGAGGDYDWVLDISGAYNGDSDITTIPYFENAATTYNYSAQRPVTKHLTLATKEYVDSRLSALEARIAALEGNA